jgi:hypothetical protein
MQNADAGDLGRLLRLSNERRKKIERENDREPDRPHRHLGDQRAHPSVCTLRPTQVASYRGAGMADE